MFYSKIFVKFYVILTHFLHSLQNVEKEKIKKTLKAKIEMAKFLQKTVKESAVQVEKQDGQTAESFAQFLDEVCWRG